MGLDVAPFVATSYHRPERLAALSSPAYDLIDPAERARLADADEHSIVHLTLPTFGVRDAARRLASWRADGTLVTDDAPALFVYDLAVPGTPTSTRGWIGAVGLDGPVAPHEATVPGVVAGRLALRTATDADLEPVVLAHDGPPGPAAELAERHTATAPVVDLVDADGVRHRLWRVTDPGGIDAVRADLAGRRAVIADGHHRWAAAQADRAARPGPGPWDRGLALLVPTGTHGPRVQAIHRVLPGCPLGRVLGVAGAAGPDAPGPGTADPARAGAPAGARGPGPFRVRRIAAPTPARALEVLAAAPDTLVLVTDGSGWAELTGPDRDRLLASHPDHATDWRDLDVALVDAGLVERCADPGPRGDRPVLLRHSVESAVAAARETGGVALLLRPTAAATVLDLAARGVLMPRKSTLFVPKPRTGLVLRCFADG